jgi:prepilin-type N-terminal cleavage/methylation domain-containing protein
MKRRGFTLIELMVVIAIIIILAAIAIPNYLTMTARAKKSRVASDFAALATALESYRTDWGAYPVAAGQTLVSTNTAYAELTGIGSPATVNVITKYTASGDQGPIAYMTSNIVDSMKNPYNSANTYMYGSATGGAHWVLYAADGTATGSAAPWLYRTDLTTTLTDLSAGTPTIP